MSPSGRRSQASNRRVHVTIRLGGVIAVACMLGLILSGCSDEAKRAAGSGTTTTSADQTERTVDIAYQRELRRIDDRLDAAMQELFSTGSFTQQQVAEAKRALAAAERDLVALEPPSAVDQAHQMYLDGVRGFPGIVDKLAAAGGDRAKIKEHLSDPGYARTVQKLDEAKRTFQQHGYEL